MRIVSALVAGLLVGFTASGCGDTCSQLCQEAGDFHDRCLDSWGQTWGSLGYADRGEFVAKCDEGVRASLDCAGTWCADSNPDDPDAAEDCVANRELGILRGCEADKETYRQPCQDYWMSLVQFGDPVLDTDPTTCFEEEDEG